MEFDAPSKTYVQRAVPTVDASFPENHSRNFTGSPYLGAIETPPHLYTQYQQQYRNFYAQKSNFAATAKPIKFEDNSVSNRFVSNGGPGLSEYGEESTASQELNTRNIPYPYVFGDGNSEDQIEQPAYPIPNNNLLESEKENSQPGRDLFIFFKRVHTVFYTLLCLTNRNSK